MALKNRNICRIIKASICAFFCIQATPTVLANTTEALVAFDGLCLGTGGDLLTLERMAAAAGAKPVAPEILNQDPSIARNGGKGFLFRRKNIKFIVTATPHGACSVLFHELDPVEIIKMLEKNYPLAKPIIDSSGPQNIYFYKIKNSSIHAGGYLMVNIPKNGFGADNYLSLGFISATLAKNNRSNSSR